MVSALPYPCQELQPVNILAGPKPKFSLGSDPSPLRAPGPLSTAGAIEGAAAPP
jgi:hypothetical protein